MKKITIFLVIMALLLSFSYGGDCEPSITRTGVGFADDARLCDEAARLPREHMEFLEEMGAEFSDIPETTSAEPAIQTAEGKGIPEADTNGLDRGVAVLNQIQMGDYKGITPDDIEAAKQAASVFFPQEAPILIDEIDGLSKDLIILEKIKKKELTEEELAKGFEKGTFDMTLEEYRDLAKKYGDRKAKRKLNRVNREIIRRQRVKRLGEVESMWGGVLGALYPDKGAQAIFGIIRREFPTASWLGLNPDEFEDKMGDFGKFLGYSLSGYETYFCRKKRSEFFVQDYPGHFTAGGDYPTLGSILYVAGRRTEYEFADWPQSLYPNLGSKPNWFPMQGTTAPEPRGYLYKISWIAGNPYLFEQYEAMSQEQRDRVGLKENGTIKYRVELTINPLLNASVPKYVFNNLPDIEPGQSKKETYVFYDKAYITKICLIFDVYKYDGSNNQKCVDVEKQTLDAPQFEYFPREETVAAATATVTEGEGVTPVTVTFSDGTTTTTTDTSCSAPPSVCCQIGYSSYC